MVDGYIRRQREQRGERLVWLQPGERVVSAHDTERLRETLERVRRAAETEADPETALVLVLAALEAAE